MNLQQRIDLLSRLGEYILSADDTWKEARDRACHENTWFIPEFIDLAAGNIARSFLRKDTLEAWTAAYSLQEKTAHQPSTVGIVMAGNIPLVGFHDLLCVFISGHKALIKPSSKDSVLVRHLVQTLAGWNEEAAGLISFSDMLKKCDAYIATGSNNSAGYFEYYFGKYPHLIRRNRTSVAILTGHETPSELEKLADDVFLYFGRGCRNVTKLYVPREYDFEPLLFLFKKYDWLSDHHKYKNNYDYNLALYLLNKQYYMSSPSALLVENPSLFSPISVLHYEFYEQMGDIITPLRQNQEVQCMVGRDFIPFGGAQSPLVSDYADGADTLAFLRNLPAVS